MTADRRGFLKLLGGGVSTAAVVASSSSATGVVTVDKLPEQGSEFASPLTPNGYNYHCNIVRWTLYDHVVAGDDHNNCAFIRGVGLHRRSTETNLYMSGGILPAPQMFQVHRIFFTFDLGNSEQDNNAFMRNCAWRLIIGMRVCASGPMTASRTRAAYWEIIDCHGKPRGLAPTDSLVLNDGKGNDFSLFIDDRQYFQMQFDVNGGWEQFAPDFGFYAYLDGLLAQGIQ